MTAHTEIVTIAPELQEWLQDIIKRASPQELYRLAVMSRDAYKDQVANNLMPLRPKLMRTLNANVEFYRRFAS